MKKLFAIFAVAAVMTACNNSSEGDKAPQAATTDSSDPAADAQKIADSASATLDTTKSKGAAAIDSIKEGASKMMNGVKEGAKVVANEVVEGAKEAGKDVKNAANKVVDKTKEVIKH
jgi:predicted small secreted protein